MKWGIFYGCALVALGILSIWDHVMLVVFVIVAVGILADYRWPTRMGE